MTSAAGAAPSRCRVTRVSGAAPSAGEVVA